MNNVRDDGVVIDSAIQKHRRGSRTVKIAKRTLGITPVFDTYWRFAAERHAIYKARLRRESGPWTSDPILQHYRFTNCYRAADRVSQYLISHVAYAGPQDIRNVVFRTLLFKFFNAVHTWQLLEREFGEITWETFDLNGYDRVLHAAFARGEKLYSPAYVIAPPALGAARKHTNHLRLIQLMINDVVHQRIADATSMRAAFHVLRRYPSIGDFIAYQLLIDINYTCALDFSEDDFVVPGPGAKDGIRKCFGSASGGIEADLIRYMTDTQQEQFSDRGLRFDGLSGRQLHLIDCQNLFCEVDKYGRIAHPDIIGISGRHRIKRRFQPAMGGLTAWFPPKWGINDSESPTEGIIA
jgi:hypothetical protein